MASDVTIFVLLKSNIRLIYVHHLVNHVFSFIKHCHIGPLQVQKSEYLLSVLQIIDSYIHEIVSRHQNDRIYHLNI